MILIPTLILILDLGPDFTFILIPFHAERHTEHRQSGQKSHSPQQEKEIQCNHDYIWDPSFSHVLDYSLQEGTAKPQDTSIPNVRKSSLSPSGELHKVPPLDQFFKKPAPKKNRRRPSQGHLKKLAVQSEDGHP